MVNFSMVIPTISRPTLGRTIKSLINQDWIESDEVIILGDGDQPIAESLVSQLGHPFKYDEYAPGPAKDWGHTPRNWLMEKKRCIGSHILALDDDDILAVNAIKTIRDVITQSPAFPRLFRMDARNVNLGILWAKPELRRANVGTPCFVTPNDHTLLGRYKENYYSGDFEFIQQTVSNFGNLGWTDFITTICRPTL